MARLSKFDREVKNKMEGLQGEPSARVWAGVRAATPASSGMSPWVLRVAAGLLLIGIVSSGAWYFTRGGGPNTGGLTDGGAQDSVQQELPQTPVHPDQQLLVQDDAEEEKLPEEAPAEVVEEETIDSATPPRSPKKSRMSPMPDLENQGVVQNEEKPSIEYRDFEPQLDKMEVPVPKDILPRELPQEVPQEEVIAEDTQQEQEDAPLEEAPEEIQGAQPENSRPSRRQYALSNLKDIDKKDVLQKSGAVLGNLALNASEKLGVKTEIKNESIDEEHDKKEFAAHIGPFSFKRVRKVKK